MWIRLFSETQTMKEKVSWKIQKAYQPKKYRQASLIPNLFDVLINIDFYAKKHGPLGWVLNRIEACVSNYIGWDIGDGDDGQEVVNGLG